MRLLLPFLLILVLIPAVVADECASEKGCETTVQYGLTAEQIAAMPQVVPEQLVPDNKLLHDRRYMRLNGAVNVYDAPDGNLIRTTDPGFVFVTAYKDENGWSRINRGEWVRTNDLTAVNWVVSRFTGIFIPEEELPYLFAWALVDIYPAAEPGGDPDESLPLIERYDLLHIYATVEIESYRWYQVGAGQWLHQHKLAKIEPLTETPSTVDTSLWFGIDLFEQVIIVYEDGRAIFASLVATGLPRWPTYEGTFHIFYRNEREHMTWGTVGDDYYLLEEVPWTMFFDDGRALHGAYWHDGFGYRRSHGCVNISITDAKWMYDKVAEYLGPDAPANAAGPAVYVYSSDVYR